MKMSVSHGHNKQQQRATLRKPFNPSWTFRYRVANSAVTACYWCAHYWDKNGQQGTILDMDNYGQQETGMDSNGWCDELERNVGAGNSCDRFHKFGS